MNQNKINNVFAIKSKDRYGYLLRKVADFECIFLIVDQDDKYVMIGSNNEKAIPVWPEKEFAKLFLIDDWKDYRIIEYDLYDFINWLEELEKEKVELAGFPNLELNTVIITAFEMRNHLLFELSKYE